MKDFKIQISYNKKHFNENVSSSLDHFFDKNINIFYSKSDLDICKTKSSDDCLGLAYLTKSDRKRICKEFKYTYSNQSDSELLLDLYNIYGIKIFEIMGNDFFFFMYNFKTNDVFIIRDHIGFNNIYYAQNEEELLLSSTLKSLQDLSEKKFDINKKVLKNFLEMNPFNDRETFFEGLNKVPPAHYLKYSSNILSIESYKKFKDIRINYNEKDQVIGLNLLLKKAIIRKEENIDENIGFLFSGGLDSSTIISFYDKYKNENQKLFSYTAQYNHIDKPIKRLIDERDFQKEIIKDKSIKERNFETKDLSTLSNLDLYLNLVGQPFFFPHLYLINEAFKLASLDNVQKVFNGADGDTVVSHGFEYLVELFLKFRWLKLFKEINKIAKVSNKSKRFIFKRAVLGQIFYDKKIYFSAKKQHRAVLSAPIHSNAIEIQSLVANYHNVKEVHPFYNMDLVNYCINVRPDLKINGFSRYILREAIKGIVPEKNRNRTDKSNLSHGLVYSFLNKDKKFIENQISNPHEIIKDLIDISTIENNWKKLLKNPRKYSTLSNIPSLIFAYVVTNKWLEIVEANNKKKT